MSKEPWYESENPDRVARALGFRIVAWIVVALVVAGIIGGAAWGISVLTAGPKGAGDVHRRNQDAGNRIYAQAHFQDLYGDIQSYGLQLKQAAADKAAHPGDSYYATTYTGLFNTCVSAVNQYNADTGKALFTDWRSAGLPDHISAQDACGDATPSK